MSEKREKTALIIGAGCAGLAAALELLLMSKDIKPIIVEKESYIGGLAATHSLDGNRFEQGPHRLFTKNKKVEDFWFSFLQKQTMPTCDDKYLNRCFKSPNGENDNQNNLEDLMLIRKRFSRIYYLGKFFDYPMKISFKLFYNIGLVKTLKIGFSYLYSIFVKKEETNLENFLINRFGNVLYKMFFEDYTKKVWGIHPKNISKEWGMQRIKKISLVVACVDAILSPLKSVLKLNKENSLIDWYYYPKHGCSQLWDKCAEKIVNLGGEIRLDSSVVAFKNDSKKITSVLIKNNNSTYELQADYIISSMPVNDLICGMENVPEQVKTVADGLIYRNHLYVALNLSQMNLKNDTDFKTVNDLCPDSWIYMQDKSLKMGRMQINNNFSPYIIKDFTKNISVGVEYFCDENDEFWNKPENEMIDFAISELESLKIIKKEDVTAAKIFKAQKAYPAYFGTYNEFSEIKNFLNGIKNIYCIGRNGQHKYNNMDHSILSGIECARILVQNENKNLLWDINTDSSYQETS